MKERQDGGQARRDKQWQVAENAVADEMARLRRLALTADSFDEMEEAVAEMGQRRQQILLGVVAEQRQPVGKASACPECGTGLENKGLKPRQLKTSIGPVEFERERWACPACGASIFPPG
jgi:ribosomal protein S27AE